MTTSRARNKPATPHPGRTVPNEDLYAYLIRTLDEQITAMQQDLVECEQVRKRTQADIKHVRRQIANLRHKAGKQ